MYSAYKTCPLLSAQDADKAIAEQKQCGFALSGCFGSPAAHAVLTCDGIELLLSNEGRTEHQSQAPSHGYLELNIQDTSGNILVYAQPLETE